MSEPAQLDRVPPATSLLTQLGKERGIAQVLDAAPGFQVVAERFGGLSCADCGAPTREVRADIYGCLTCEHRKTRERVGLEHADPRSV